MNVEYKNENHERNKTSYIGSTEGTFKTRLYHYKNDLNIIENKNKTTFANRVRDIKDSRIKCHTKYLNNAKHIKDERNIARCVSRNVIRF